MAEKEQATPETGECSCCFESRRAQNLPPRKLIELSVMTAGYNKRKQGVSVHVCEVCDGPAPH